MAWHQWVTLAIAVLGAGLGIFNAWQGWRDRAVRLRVIPKYARPFDDNGLEMGIPCVSIEVQNLSAFPVTIEEIGLIIGRPKGNLPRRAPFPPSAVIMGERLPHRLERHDAISLVVPISSLRRDNYTAGYARTASGNLTLGASAALGSIVEVLQEGSRRRR